MKLKTPNKDRCKRLFTLVVDSHTSFAVHFNKQNIGIQFYYQHTYQRLISNTSSAFTQSLRLRNLMRK